MSVGDIKKLSHIKNYQLSNKYIYHYSEQASELYYNNVAQEFWAEKTEQSPYIFIIFLPHLIS